MTFIIHQILTEIKATKVKELIIKSRQNFNWDRTFQKRTNPFKS